MKTKHLVWLSLGAATIFLLSRRARGYVPEGYSLIWNDEFNGPLVDESKWVKSDCINTSWLCDDTHYALSENVTIENIDGATCLVLTCTKDDDGIQYRAEVRSRNSGTGETKFAFKYGYVEIRAKLIDGDLNTGLSSHLWFYGERRWPPEVNLVEIGSGPMDTDLYSVNRLNLSLHCNSVDSSCTGLSPQCRDSHTCKNIDIEIVPCPECPSDINKVIAQRQKTVPKYVHDQYGNPVDLSQAFHIYAMEWTPEYVSLLLDGVEYHRFTASTPQEKMQIVLGATPDVWASGPVTPDTPFPRSMYVDYVRVYQKK